MLTPSTAKEESLRALKEVYAAIDSGSSFCLEAGAGAGKTHSLVEVIRYILSQEKNRQATEPIVACITYTNVARDEIMARLDNNPLVSCDTIHGFSWGLMAQFQKELRRMLKADTKWRARQERSFEIVDQPVAYSLGIPRVTDDEVSLGHDDVIKCMALLLQNEKFRQILGSRFAYILIDEYQDTDARLMNSIGSSIFDAQAARPVIGLFGDHWQQIYPRVCGKVIHPRLRHIGKGANFRSAPEVVRVLNNMRTELPQIADRSEAAGAALVYHTNSWGGVRLSGGHWKGDLPVEEGRRALELAQHDLRRRGWFVEQTKNKILMLTHRALAATQGYESLPDIFPYSDVFRKLEDPHLEYFVEKLEPACELYERNDYGAMFELLQRRRPVISSVKHKRAIVARLDSLLALRRTGTVADVVEYLAQSSFPGLPARVDRKEQALKRVLESEAEMSRSLQSLADLRKVNYAEVIAFSKFHQEKTLYATKHGVKGAEFDDVLVVAGRGWSMYNFNDFLAAAGGRSGVMANADTFERNRNLFYVACSRARNNLALLFTVELSESSLDTLSSWFGQENVIALDL